MYCRKSLQQRNVDRLEKIALAVSDPKSPDYQAYLSIGEIRALVSPLEADQNRVIAALAEAGITEVVNLGDALDVRGPAKAVEHFFSATLRRFTSAKTGKSIVRVFGSYTVPAAIVDMVVMVAGLSTFPVPHLNGTIWC